MYVRIIIKKNLQSNSFHRTKQKVRLHPYSLSDEMIERLYNQLFGIGLPGTEPVFAHGKNRK